MEEFDGFGTAVLEGRVEGMDSIAARLVRV
jgi:hypothetical protein